MQNCCPLHKCVNHQAEIDSKFTELRHVRTAKHTTKVLFPMLIVITTTLEIRLHKLRIPYLL